MVIILCYQAYGEQANTDWGPTKPIGHSKGKKITEKIIKRKKHRVDCVMNKHKHGHSGKTYEDFILYESSILKKIYEKRSYDLIIMVVGVNYQLHQLQILVKLYKLIDFLNIVHFYTFPRMSFYKKFKRL